MRKWEHQGAAVHLPTKGKPFPWKQYSNLFCDVAVCAVHAGILFSFMWNRIRIIDCGVKNQLKYFKNEFRFKMLNSYVENEKKHTLVFFLFFWNIFLSWSHHVTSPEREFSDIFLVAVCVARLKSMNWLKKMWSL